MHPSAQAQTSWSTYRNEDLQFRFLHPSDWYFGTARGPNVKATLFPPDSKPRANCNIVVQSSPETKGSNQSALNAEISSTTLTASDWKEMMGQKWPDLRVVESKHVKVDNQPAFYAVEEHSHQTVDRTTYVKGAMLTTLTPGHVWTFACAGKGDTKSEAQESFRYWEPTFNRILGSLVFESQFGSANVEDDSKQSSRPSPADMVQLGASASASRLWSNKTEGFAAAFPDTPEKVEAVTGQAAAHAYQCTKSFTNGGALYAITVFQIPSTIKENSLNSFLEMSHDAYLKSMAQDPKKAKVSWSSFGDGRKRLDYDCEYAIKSIPFKERGFYIIDRGRSIKVSISYTESLTSKEANEAVIFLQTFVLIN
jgi:hypothetical protein